MICCNVCVMSSSGRFVVCICVYGRYMMCGGDGCVFVWWGCVVVV